MLKKLRILALTWLCSPCFGVDAAPGLSLEDKIGQLLMVHFQGEVANEDARILIQDVKVGGIIYYNWSNGLNSSQQVQALSVGLQKLTERNQSPIPLLIATDQEGGVVARLTNGFTKFPGNKALGESGEPSLAKAAAFAMGQELQVVGINMNLAPVVDVNSNPRNPIIGVRSFGENPETVVIFAQKALDGYRQAEIIATLKHFPGHGDTEIDSHEDLPVVRKSLEELEKVELVPFAQLSKMAPVIMTAHLLVPALDVDHCSTLSAKTLSYLRNKIGFQGVIIADSLVMQGVLKRCQTVDEAAIRALNAGCDILLLGGKQLVGEHTFELTVDDVKRIHSSLVKAVQENRISEERVNQAVDRILTLKKRYIAPKNELASLDEVVNTLAHREIAQQIATRALKTIKKVDHSISDLRDKKIMVFAPHLLKDSIDQTSLLQMGKATNSWFFGNLSPSSVDIATAKQNAAESDVLLVCSYNAWRNPSQVTLIQTLIDTGKPVILISMRDPLDASLFPEANLIFNTFSPTAPSIQAICNQLERM
ncbi:MAG: glycoside hydrolase family 3 protein [Chlamydiales bacterium]|nr:glycoside hydrolase family 3 protein [Chlamydiales bacterium]